MTSEHQKPEAKHDESEEVRRRLLLPLLIPAIIFLFGMLAIYGLSRIYLDLASFQAGDVNAATPLALGVALAILGSAWYLAATPKISRAAVGGIVTVAVAVLIGGSIWAAVYDEGEAEAPGPEPTADGGPPPAGTVNVSLIEFEVIPNPTSVPAGDVTFVVKNDGATLHNLRVIKTDLDPAALPANAQVDESQLDVVASTEDLEAGQTVEVSAELEPGAYVLICNFPGHYASGMRTAFTVEEGGAAPPTDGGATPPPDGGPPAGPTITMGDNFFEFEGQQEPAIPVAAGEEVTFSLVNNGVAVHNMHVDGQDGEYAEDFCETGGEVPCSDPAQLVSGATGTITVQFDAAGTYQFRCDYHPTDMLGTFVVE